MVFVSDSFDFVVEITNIIGDIHCLNQDEMGF